MSDRVLISKSLITAIADKFRASRGTANSYRLDEMPSMIDDDSWKNIYHGTVTTNSSSTTATQIQNVKVDITGLGSGEYELFIRVKSTKTTSGYCRGGEHYLPFFRISDSSALTHFSRCYGRYSSSSFLNYYGTGTTCYGVYPYSIVPATGTLLIYRRYSSGNSGTINDTFTIDVYARKARFEVY